MFGKLQLPFIVSEMFRIIPCENDDLSVDILVFHCRRLAVEGLPPILHSVNSDVRWKTDGAPACCEVLVRRMTCRHKLTAATADVTLIFCDVRQLASALSTPAPVTWQQHMENVSWGQQQEMGTITTFLGTARNLLRVERETRFCADFKLVTQ